MATEEARSLLDALMGGDRNAPLPAGSALPPPRQNRYSNRHRGSNKRSHGSSSPAKDGDAGGGGVLLLPGKRRKSCYDADIDPLYTAWGVDVYELFVNTKSDLGSNPSVADDGAREEFLRLPPKEQERLGYHHRLFLKLSELVKQCDRTVQRNKEKLNQELSRKLSQRGGQDFVQDVDDNAAEQLCRNIVQYQDGIASLNEKYRALHEVTAKEDLLKRQLEPLLKQSQQQHQQQQKQPEGNSSAAGEQQKGGVQTKEESDGGGPAVEAEANKSGDGDDKMAVVKQEEGTEEENDKTTEPESNGAGTGPVVKVENKNMNTDEVNEGKKGSANDDGKNTEATETAGPQDLHQLQMELGKVTLQKQMIVFEMSQLVTSTILPAQDSVESQYRNLNYVKSDISTDKTVCEISGNFMSSRDADERIAAHYAGKQYVGWKLVRDKLQEMQRHFGKYGPPQPPPGGNSHLHGGPASHQQHQQQRVSHGGGGGGGGPRGGGGGRGYGGGGGYDRDRYGDRGGGGSRGRYDSGGGYRGDRGGDRGGRWERHGPNPHIYPPSHDRGRRSGSGPPPSRGPWRR